MVVIQQTPTKEEARAALQVLMEIEHSKGNHYVASVLRAACGYLEDKPDYTTTTSSSAG